tara:strand:+ start:248 stop:382 length:135 start_codon:yes stop_codon:yes gene_type:complete
VRFVTLIPNPNSIPIDILGAIKYSVLPKPHNTGDLKKEKQKEFK